MKKETTNCQPKRGYCTACGHDQALESTESWYKLKGITDELIDGICESCRWLIGSDKKLSNLHGIGHFGGTTESDQEL